MLRTFIGGLTGASLLFGGGVAMAGSPAQCPAQADSQGEHANVLVVRTQIGADGTQQRDNATIIPLHVDLARDSNGDVDVDQVAQQTSDQLDACDSIAVQANGAENAPQAVQQAIDQAGQSSEQEMMPWSYWSPYYGGGYYGYGYQPYYGYYSHYYPYYGYYYGGYTYPYYYGGYYPYGGYGYSYYYR